MLTVSNLGLRFADRKLFEEVNLNFLPSNCYGVIGANGAGKSTFLNILSRQLEPTSGDVIFDKNLRMSILKQNHSEFDDQIVMDTVIMGNKKLHDIKIEKDALYCKEDFTDEDGIKAGELEFLFGELGGYESESDASYILQGLGIPTDIHYTLLKELTGVQKVKVLLSQALFGKPDILILDEPTNHLDIDAIAWLEEFIINFEGTVIVVSHDRHFLNNVCTYICDVDYGKINLFSGNYDFWYESNQLMQRLLKDQNKKKEDKIKELQDFIQRFSANKSKSKQATSRKKALEKIKVEDMVPSNRKYPFIHFKFEKELGKDILTITDLTKEINGQKVLNNFSLSASRDDKIAFLGNEIAITALFKILMGEMEQDSGTIKWGITTNVSYFPKDNEEFFTSDYSLVDWLRQYSEDQNETFIRGFLGRMLFSGEEALKEVNVLSGGEKVRLMFSRMMLQNSNVLILDQPTNHLDLESIQALNKGLEEYKSFALFTTHDHLLIETVANRIIEINNDGSVLDKMSTFEEFLAYKKQLN